MTKDKDDNHIHIDVKDKDGIELEKKDADEKKKPDIPPVKWSALLRYATTRDKVYMFIGTIGAILNGCVLPLFSLVFGELLDSFQLPTDEERAAEVEKWTLAFVAIGAGAWIFSWLEIAFWTISAENQVKVLRAEFLKAILRQNIGWFDVQETGALTSRLAEDTNVFQQGISEKVGAYIHFMATFVTGLVIGFIKGWQLALIILAVTPLLAIAGGMMGKLMSDATKESLESYAIAGGVASESIANIRTVQSFCAEEQTSKRYNKQLMGAYESGAKKGKLVGASWGFTLMVMFGTYALALWYGHWLIINGVENAASGRPYTVGDVLAVFFSVLMGAFALGQASPSIPVMASGKQAGANIFNVIDRKSEIDALDESGEEIDDFNGEIKFENVTFSYPTRKEVTVFDRLSFTIKAGERVAFVGSSGSGKSTVTNLAMRFYDADDGDVLFDGKSIKKLKLSWLRAQIGMVSQQPVLFGASVRENIRYGNKDASDQDIENAAKASSAHGFISRLPKGYDTIVRNELLSGGEKQRVAIARAIVRDPKILIFDEATSALDSKNEKVVQHAIDDLLKVKKTTIIIAHRLSTIRDADRIFVVREGQIVEKGTHDELMEMGGVYSELVTIEEHETVEEEKLEETIEEKSYEERVEELKKKKEEEKAKEKTAEDIKKEVAEIKVDWGRIMDLIGEHKGAFWIGTFCAMAIGSCWPLFSVIFADMVSVLALPDGSGVDEKAYQFIALGVIMFIMAFGQSWGLSVAGEWLTYQLRKTTFNRILYRNIGFFDQPENDPGALTTKLATEASLVHGASTTTLGVFLQMIVTLGLGLGIAFYNGWQLALTVVATAPLMIIAGVIQMKFMGGFSGESKKAFEKAGTTANESISNIRTVQAFGAEKALIKHFDTLLVAPHAIGKKSAHTAGIGFGFSQGIMFFSYALAFYYGGYLIRQGVMDLQQVLKTFFAITMAAMGVGQSGSLMPDATKAKLAYKSIFAIIDGESEIDASKDDGEKIEVKEGDIEFQDIDFHYPTRQDIQILKGFNLKIKAGSSVAFVGESGAGKSTLFQLLQLFYRPNKGKVLVDGKDISELHLKTYRGQLGLVSQEPIMFSTTILENIRYGKADADEKEVEEACKSSNIHEFIASQPDQYKTQAGAKGAQLSGGQKQRCCIARAIVKSPKILLLDESTSALDNESEKLVQDALDKMMEVNEFTTLVIAHRLSTIRNCDQIVVLSRNIGISEMGTHEELVEKNGIYASMLKAANA